MKKFAVLMYIPPRRRYAWPTCKVISVRGGYWTFKHINGKAQRIVKEALGIEIISDDELCSTIYWLKEDAINAAKSKGYDVVSWQKVWRVLKEAGVL
jgi:hypothetical protein